VNAGIAGKVTGRNMLRALKIFSVLAVGIMLGLAATWATVIHGTKSEGISDGPWRTSLLAGSSEAGPYLRAYIAVHGLLALSREETVYYSAARDSEGHTLDGNCSYQLEWRDPPTRWWSITAYGPDDFLIPNPADRYSVSMNSVARRADGTFAVTLSKKQVGVDWIPLAAGRFDLTIRLYNPQAAVVADPGRVTLPTIRKAVCE
jgi:hypothetical protein